MQSERITVSVPHEIAEQARQAVSDGRAASVSAYLSEAAAQRVRRDQRARVIWDTWGPFTPAELEAADAVLDGGRRLTARPSRPRDIHTERTT